MKKEEAIEWLEVMKETSIFEQYEALKMAIEALQTAEINCVHCPRYYEVEDDIGVHSHCGGSHGRLIDADALMEYCSNQKSKTISNNDIARFSTVSADRPQGEWIDVNGDGSLWRCSRCKDTACCNGNYCPTCGVKMKGGEDDAVQGEWIDKGEYAECSICGAHSGTQFDGVEPISLKTNFCSNCGMRMKGGEDE